MKRNRVIGLALALALCGLSPARAETPPLRQPDAKAEKAKAAEKPSAVRQLIDLLLRKQVAPAHASPIRTSPIGPIGLSIDDPDLPLCTDVTDPTIPCRVRAPIGG